jgi:hypothetical protein
MRRLLCPDLGRWSAWGFHVYGSYDLSWAGGPAHVSSLLAQLGPARTHKVPVHAFSIGRLR